MAWTTVAMSPDMAPSVELVSHSGCSSPLGWWWTGRRRPPVGRAGESLPADGEVIEKEVVPARSDLVAGYAAMPIRFEAREAGPG